ncbi:helix-turn-helix transcriptional regulator [Litoribacter alkaliphilus]|uniref:Helix-turn-helix transcriptional regulator n=1 Tax=Litoribacter ruber TaxID=702568 RepID=A0AAP2G6B9_9BACT|nr:helix-turn-helix transcriptional regulator [Litoribacter alkaliphilus]MBS9525906.1 helix-turn-helix transcriptional regulator [Litoribacter alkaliphilus]
MNKTIHKAEYKALIHLLREIRENAGITQKELAQELGTDQTFISKVETGERRLDVIELKSLCDALGIDFQEFIKELLSKIK